MFIVDWFYDVLASLGLWQKQKEAKILLLGLDNAGRTALLQMLPDEPTQYPTSVELSIGKIKFKVFDLGGYSIACQVLRDYYVKVDAIVYLLNVGDGIEEIELMRVLKNQLFDDLLPNVPFFIMGNTIDHEYLTSEELRYYFSQILQNVISPCIPYFKPDPPFEVFMCWFGRRLDFEIGFKWLSQYIK